MINLLKLVLIGVFMFALVACEQKKETAEIEAEAEKPSRVISMTEVTTVMTVEEIDLPERLFTLKYDDGNVIVLEAAPDLTNIEKIKVGDRVEVTYLKSKAVYVTAPDKERPAVTQSRSVQVDTKDGKPRKYSVDVIEETSTVEAIDLENRMVTLKDHEGNIETIEVSDELQNLENVKVGDQVVLQMTEAFAVDIAKVEE